MLQRSRAAVSPQSKNISVNDKFGNTGIKRQQGSTIVKYDTLPIDGRTEYRFFEGSAQRNFPFSNTGSDGNKLGVGNSMVVERVYLAIVTVSERGFISKVQELSLTGLPGIICGELGFSIANSEVIKTIPILSFLPQFNKLAENAVNTSFDFDTQVIIPPLLEYICTIRAAEGVIEANTFLRLTIEGSGAIIAPRTTF
jgi:hypothetical protein